MKPTESHELQSVGIDLHVHTPASNDYKGNRDDEKEYLAIIRKANEFGMSSGALHAKQSRESGKAIGCIAFTDHNSVEGFRKYREVQQKTRDLRDSLRPRDPANPYLKQLDKVRISILKTQLQPSANLQHQY